MAPSHFIVLTLSSIRYDKTYGIAKTKKVWVNKSMLEKHQCVLACLSPCVFHIEIISNSINHLGKYENVFTFLYYSLFSSTLRRGRSLKGFREVADDLFAIHKLNQKFSNTSASWITRNKYFLKWSQHGKYCIYTLQIWENEDSIYVEFKTNESMKNIGSKFTM